MYFTFQQLHQLLILLLISKQFKVNKSFWCHKNRVVAQRVWRGIQEVMDICVQYIIAIVVFSARLEFVSRGKPNSFSFKANQCLQINWCIKWPHILYIYIYLYIYSYPHANLGHVIVAEIIKHSRPVLAVDIKRTHGSLKRTLRLRFYINGAIKHILIDIL